MFGFCLLTPRLQAEVCCRFSSRGWLVWVLAEVVFQHRKVRMSAETTGEVKANCKPELL